jgi:hypothetical protein
MHVPVKEVGTVSMHIYRTFPEADRNEQDSCGVFIFVKIPGICIIKTVITFLFLGSATCCAHFIKVIRITVPRNNSSMCLFYIL